MEAQGLGEAAERLRRATVRVLDGMPETRGSGSGVIWTSDGTVVTNAHVARGEAARVELWDGSGMRAEVVSRDERRDLARLKIPATRLPAAEWRDSGSLRAGEVLIAVGNPLGFVGALATGVAHASGPVRGLGRRSWVQAAIRLAPGNSGGPLADAAGRVVGINTMAAGRLALAIPSETVARFVEHGAPPALGVTLQPVPQGLLVLQVSRGSPAERASLLPGDLLVGFDSPDDLRAAIDSGGPIHLKFRRGDRRAIREVAVYPRVH